MWEEFAFILMSENATWTVGQTDGVRLWAAGLLLSSVDSRLLFLRRRDLLTGSLCLSSASLLSPVTCRQNGQNHRSRCRSPLAISQWSHSSGYLRVEVHIQSFALLWMWMEVLVEVLVVQRLVMRVQVGV